MGEAGAGTRGLSASRSRPEALCGTLGVDVAELDAQRARLPIAQSSAVARLKRAGPETLGEPKARILRATALGGFEAAALVAHLASCETEAGETGSFARVEGGNLASDGAARTRRQAVAVSDAHRAPWWVEARRDWVAGSNRNEKIARADT